MQTQLLNKTHSSIYPGEYIPLFEKEDLSKCRKNPPKAFLRNISESIEELENCYVIHLRLPGARRKDFLVEVCENFLNVIILPSGFHLQTDSGRLASRRIYHRSFIHSIPLPPDADPLFVSAKFSAGMLEVYIPKSVYPVKGIHTMIAVY